ncbi:MAG: DUF4367 domain-containing protein [Oscillospiraceae bacterium]
MFLALLLTGIGWLTIDAEARAATIAWFRSISQNSIVYRFLNPTPQQTLPDYTPTWLPDGFEEQEHHKDDLRSSWYYVSGSDFIVIEVDVYHSGTVLSLIGDHSGYEEVHVNQFTALFVPVDGNSGISNLVWMDEQNGLMFSVGSTLEKSVMLHIAESIELLQSPNQKNLENHVQKHLLSAF